GVNIPGCFSTYNDKYLLGDKHNRWKYMQTLGVMSKQPAYASLCKDCGKCELHCPQHIEVRKQLKTVRKELEGFTFKPMVTVARKILRVK
ncbi:MAG TPA: aldo/keto reductase, partial [Mobilitalea sp.]|nr:aldo/keto reductase [Mobilitalea sp.]